MIFCVTEEKHGCFLEVAHFQTGPIAILATKLGFNS